MYHPNGDAVQCQSCPLDTQLADGAGAVDVGLLTRLMQSSGHFGGQFGYSAWNGTTNRPDLLLVFLAYIKFLKAIVPDPVHRQRAARGICLCRRFGEYQDSCFNCQQW